MSGDVPNLVIGSNISGTTIHKSRPVIHMQSDSNDKSSNGDPHDETGKLMCGIGKLSLRNRDEK